GRLPGRAAGARGRGHVPDRDRVRHRRRDRGRLDHLDQLARSLDAGVRAGRAGVLRHVRREVLADQGHVVRVGRHLRGVLLRLRGDERRGGGRPRDHAGGGREQHADPGARRLLGGGAVVSIRLWEVRKSFGSRAVLDGVSLEVGDGETVALVGFSGSGKSVLLKTIVGLLKPDSGAVFVDGKDVGALRREELYALRRQVGYVFQFAALFDSMTVAENVAMGLRRVPGITEAQIQERIEESLRLVELEGYGPRYPGQLSGGQRKRVGLARAIATRPRYVLYDEPTTGLDPVTTAV